MLEWLDVERNQLSGPIPCPSHPEPKLKTIKLSLNHFTGALPACLFTAAPRLQTLGLDYLELTSNPNSEL